MGRQKTFQNRRARKTCVSSTQNDVFLQWRSCPEQKHYFCKHPGQHNSFIKPYQNSILNPVQPPIFFCCFFLLVGGRPWRLSPGRLTSASVWRCLGRSWPAWPVTVRGSRPGWGPSRAQQQTRHRHIYIYIYIYFVWPLVASSSHSGSLLTVAHANGCCKRAQLSSVSRLPDPRFPDSQTPRL